MEMKELNSKMAKGAAWMVMFKFAERGLGLISTMILARLLIPADFGLVAMAMSIIAVLDIMGSFSFDLALIQNQNADRRHYDTAWTFTVLYGVFSSTVLVILAYPTSLFYVDSRLELVMYVLALGTLIQGFENIGVVAFQKDLSFRREFLFRLSKKLVGFIGTIIIAIVYKNYWALVIGTVISRLSGVLFSYLAHPYRPSFSMTGRKDLFHFSKWMFFNNIILFVNSRGIDFVIGKVAGAGALGLYTVAYEVSNMPTTELVFPISRAIFPGYVKMANDIALLRKGFLDVFGVIVLFAMPASVGIATLADPIVMAFLGERWKDAVQLIQILSIFGLIRACSSNTGSMYLAIGRPNVIAIFTILNIGILIPLLILAVPKFGAVGAAFAITVAAAIQLPLNYLYLSRKIELKILVIAGRAWRPAVASIIMGWGIESTNEIVFLSSLDSLNWIVKLAKDMFVLSPVGNVLYVLVMTTVGAIIYFVTDLLLWVMSGKPLGSEKVIMNLIYSKIFGRSGLRVK